MLLRMLHTRLLSAGPLSPLSRQHSRAKLRPTKASSFSDEYLAEQPPRPSKSSSKRKGELPFLCSSFVVLTDADGVK